MLKGLLFLLLTTFIINAQTIINVPGDYATIASAVSNASAGDIIKIGPGTFAEQLVIQKDLTIVGSGKNKTLIQESPAIDDSTALFIDHAAVTVRDLQINGFENNDGRRRGIVSLNSNLTIRQCDFVMMSNVALAIVNGSLDADSLLITCINSGSNTAQVDSGQYGAGFGLGMDNGIMLMNAHFNIRHLTGGASIDHVIDIYPNSNNYVLTRKYPADLSQFTQGTIENCTIYGELDFSYGQGIRVFGDITRPEGAAQLIIRNNRIKGLAVDSNLVVPNRWNCAGIAFAGANGFAEIYGNSIQYFNAGISLYGYSTANIHDNTIINNARYGIITSWGGGSYAGQVDLGGGVYASPGRNIIHSNGQYDIFNRNTLEVFALHNDWGTTDVSAINAEIFDNSDDPGIGVVSYDVGSLPVELTCFTASIINEGTGRDVLLQWQTATEVNNYGFEVQRSSPALDKSKIPASLGEGAGGGWIPLGFTRGHGNSSSPEEYSFVDLNPPAGDLLYRLKQIDLDGNYKYYSQLAEVNFSPTGVNETSLARPTEFGLFQNYPNPFNPTTTIEYQIPTPLALGSQGSRFDRERGAGGEVVGDERGVSVTLKVYDMLGKEVAALVNENQSAGNYKVEFDAGRYGLTNGVYFYKLSAGGYVSVKKFILLK